jgi:hypothetical protein
MSMETIEHEIETVMVLSKKLKLRTISGQLVVALLKVFECESPYIIVLLVETEYGHSMRTDVQKEDLASELRFWLEGKQVRHPAVLVPLRIEESITRFVKFGKTPLQEDLIMWLLSRSEMYLGEGGVGGVGSVGGVGGVGSGGGYASELVFGGKSQVEVMDTYAYERTDNEYSKNAYAAVSRDQFRDQQYRINDAAGRGSKLEFSLPHGSNGRNGRAHTGTGTRAEGDTGDTGDMGMFSMTRKLLGKSATLESMRKSKVQGREGARQSVTLGVWNSDHLSLASDVEKARRKIEEAMDDR